VGGGTARKLADRSWGEVCTEVTEDNSFFEMGKCLPEKGAKERDIFPLNNKKPTTKNKKMEPLK
jgi:putative heme iron utilization protein